MTSRLSPDCRGGEVCFFATSLSLIAKKSSDRLTSVTFDAKARSCRGDCGVLHAKFPAKSSAICLSEEEHGDFVSGFVDLRDCFLLMMGADADCEGMYTRAMEKEE